MAAPASVAVLAPAKINLTLQVLGRRADGYHDLVSWVAPVQLFDEMMFSEAAGAGVALSCDAADVPIDGSNLVVRAATELGRAAGIQPRLAITLRKRIPLEAGLGGGSSDAAATLIGLNRLWGLDWPRERLADIGAKIGSDVPLFLAESPCIIRGRGVRVEPLRRGREAAVVLVLPPFGVATAEVYGAMLPQDAVVRPEPYSMMGLPADELSHHLFNDLEPPAFRVEPRLGELRARLERDFGRPVRMSGSGSTLFAIFADFASAQRWLQRVDAASGGEYRMGVCSTWFSERK